MNKYLKADSFEKEFNITDCEIKRSCLSDNSKIRYVIIRRPQEKNFLIAAIDVNTRLPLKCTNVILVARNSDLLIEAMHIDNAIHEILHDIDIFIGGNLANKGRDRRSKKENRKCLR